MSDLQPSVVTITPVGDGRILQHLIGDATTYAETYAVLGEPDIIYGEYNAAWYLPDPPEGGNNG